MKKNILYTIALLGLLSCKKSTNVVEPINPATTSDPYKHSRPIEVSSDDGTMSKYSYNVNGQLARQDYLIKDNNGTYKLFSSQTYNYTGGKLTQVILENASTTKYITDYKYQGNTDIIESTISNGIDYQNPTKPETTSTLINEFSYEGGKISKTINKTPNNITNVIVSYLFSTKGENPVVAVNYFPQSVNGIPANPPFSYTTEFTKDLINPISYFSNNSTSVSMYMPKSGTSITSTGNSSYIQTCDLDGQGRIKTVTATYSPAQTVVKTNYTYEAY